jgi:uncharacterized protein (TIGR02265 family)
VPKRRPSSATESVVRYERPTVPDAEKLVRLPLDLVLRTVEDYLTPAIRAEVRTEFAAYLGRRQTPPLELNRMLDFLAVRCLPSYSLDEARRWMGTRGLFLYSQTLLIQVTYFGVRQMSIERILRSLPLHFTTAQNFGTYEMRKLAPRHWRFTLQDYPVYPSAVQGYCEEGARLLRNDTKYNYTIVSTHHCYFDITWETGRLDDKP